MSKTKTVEDFDRQIARLQAEKRALLQRQKAAERKARNHALMVMGAMVEQACGGDWRNIDFYDLDAYFAKWAKSISRAAEDDCVSETLEEAKSHVREYEKWKREEAKKAKRENADDDAAEDGSAEGKEEEASEADEAELDYAKYFKEAVNG